MRRLTALCTGALFFSLVGPGLPASAAAPATAHCGDVITQSIRLTADLVCAGDGLTVTGPGVTLDLGRHTLSGDGTGTGVLASGARVTNGFVRAFGADIELDGIVRLDHVGVSGAAFVAAIADHGSTSTIDHAVFESNAAGFSMQDGTSSATISDTRFASNGRAIGIIGGSLTVSRSVFVGNQTVASCFQAVMKISRSVAQHNGTGLDFNECEGSLVDRSLFDDDGVAVRMTDFMPVVVKITHSTFTHNTTGVALSNVGFLAGSAITNNTFRANGVGLSGGQNNVICTYATCDRYLLSGNTFDHNTQDGLQLGSMAAAADVRANTATGNGGWGLFVDMANGSIDGGSNVAWGNGQAAQCAGVTCATH